MCVCIHHSLDFYYQYYITNNNRVYSHDVILVSLTSEFMDNDNINNGLLLSSLDFRHYMKDFNFLKFSFVEMEWSRQRGCRRSRRIALFCPFLVLFTTTGISERKYQRLNGLIHTQCVYTFDVEIGNCQYAAWNSCLLLGKDWSLDWPMYISICIIMPSLHLSQLMNHYKLGSCYKWWG